MPAAAYPSPNRQKALIRYSLTTLLLLCPLIAQGKINVVATLPDLGSLAREIGKDKIEIVVLGKPNDNPHFVEPHPDFVASLHNADVLIDGGRGTWSWGWLPPHLAKGAQSET
jgi:zinc/manganese transport system substrate-binding protein